MSDKRSCPECGISLSPNAPQGLCPRCLMGAAIRGTATFTPTHEPEDATPAATNPAVDFEDFRRSILDLVLVDPGQLDKYAEKASGDISALSRALVRAGKLTTYHSGALAQGKAKGLVIGDYLVLDKLGQGGMGVVFKARQRQGGRVVALKILPPSFGREREVVMRFRREFEVAARLSHPNVVTALDASEDRGVQFLTMDFIDGYDLDELVSDIGPLPIKTALHCTIQAARGLEAAHAQGIIHRDVKPANLMLDASGNVRVLDLGLARVIEASSPLGKNGGQTLTQSGAYMGTVDYIAPEQADDSKKADARSDIYSLGCTLYFLLASRPPFPGDTVLKKLMAHQQQPAPSLHSARSDVPSALEGAYQTMMAKRPGDRPRSMTEVIALLEACGASADDSKEAKSGLKKAFAETVMKRASPKQRRGLDATIFARPGPSTGLQFDSDLKLEDLVGDYRDELGHGTIPEEKLPPIAARPLPRKPRRNRTTAPYAYAVAAIALGGLAIAAYALRPGTPTTPPTLPEPAPASLAAPSFPTPGFRPLFTGNDLSGWIPHNTKLEDWQLRDGILSVTGHGKDNTDLLTRQKYSDFVFKVEFQLSPGGDGGLVFARDATGNGPCLEINVGGDVPARMTGIAFWSGHSAMTETHWPTSPNTLKPAEAWNALEAECRAGMLTIKLNGQTVTHKVSLGPLPGPLRIGFDAQKGTVRYRQAEIKELSPIALLDRLDAPFSLELKDGTLQELLEQIKSKTVGPNLPDGLPVFVDPRALSKVGIRMSTRVTMEANGVPLKDALRLSLQPLGLSFTVQDGTVKIGTPSATSDSGSLAPQTPRVLFADDYSTPLPYWTATSPEQLAETPSHRWGHRDGVYFDEITAADKAFGGHFLPGGPYPDFSCEIVARITGDKPTSKGSMQVHVVREGRGLLVRIDGSGALFIEPSWHMNDSQPSTPWIGPIFHQAIKQGGGDFNKLRLDVAKRRLDVFVNSVRVCPPLTFDWDITSAAVELAVSCKTPSVRAEFDSVEIKTLAKSKTDETGNDSAKSIRVTNGGGKVLPDGTWVFEAAHLRVLGKSGGNAYPQANMDDFPDGLWSSHRQLYWNGPKVGDTLQVDVPLEMDGQFEVFGRFTQAEDYGRAKLELDGKPLLGGKFIDLFSPNVKTTDFLPLGFVSVKKGTTFLRVTMVGKSRAATHFNFGLDELRFVPVR
jgi:serine/threonine protein kinase